ncbi:DNA ligase D [Bacillus timonensis]|nr:DNA ligase D [Bacillus timonensis]
MLPTLIHTPPQGEDWVYEIKYDGFRAILYLEKDSVNIISRNGNLLNDQFPEVISFCKQRMTVYAKELPLTLDGELCILESSVKANFEQIQLRGRLKDNHKIEEYVKRLPATFLAFDLLELKGKKYTNEPYTSRKQQLKALFEDMQLSTDVQSHSDQRLQYVEYKENYDLIWKSVLENDSEGVIAKKSTSKWENGKRTSQWYKIKNLKKGAFFVTKYDKKNGFFHVAVYRDGANFEIGLFSHGLQPVERDALIGVIRNNAENEDAAFIYVTPGICVELFFLELYKDQLRQPSFSAFLLDMNWKDCTWEKLIQSSVTLTHELAITNPDKPLFRDRAFSKQDYINYLFFTAPYILPFLKNRLLTVIRYPHGEYGESFYQKNCPDYAPDYIHTHEHEDINYIVCNDDDTLAWLGNQLAFEFHIPFETIDSTGASEIVFDLDPPSRDDFHLAIRAALILKEVFDGLKLISFIKTSGNKGLQIYIPLPDNTYSYDQTRVFTEFIANYLTTSEPQYFTTERLKKNRGNRLYVDYLQHAEGKTIVAPYSVRMNAGGYVATPLYWDEVTDSLSIEQFPIESIQARIKEKGCPFTTYFEAKQQQNFDPVLQFLYKGNMK